MNSKIYNKNFISPIVKIIFIMYIFLELWLMPKNKKFGKGGSITGQIRISQARGHKILLDNGNVENCIFFF